MRKIKTISKLKSAALPGKPLSPEELLAIVKQAEMGPFFTLEESKMMFEEWKKKYYGS